MVLSFIKNPCVLKKCVLRGDKFYSPQNWGREGQRVVGWGGAWESYSHKLTILINRMIPKHQREKELVFYRTTFDAISANSCFLLFGDFTKIVARLR